MPDVAIVPSTQRPVGIVNKDGQDPGGGSIVVEVVRCMLLLPDVARYFSDFATLFGQAGQDGQRFCHRAYQHYKHYTYSRKAQRRSDSLLLGSVTLW